MQFKWLLKKYGGFGVEPMPPRKGHSTFGKGLARTLPNIILIRPPYAHIDVMLSQKAKVTSSQTPPQLFCYRKAEEESENEARTSVNYMLMLSEMEYFP